MAYKKRLRKKSGKKRGKKQVKKRCDSKRPVASAGGLSLHQVGGSLKGFRQRVLKNFCNHPRRQHILI